MDVILKRIEEYNYQKIVDEIEYMFNYFHFLDDMNESSNVFVKLNCVGPFDLIWVLLLIPLF